MTDETKEAVLKLHNAARAVIEGQYRLLSFLYAKCSFHLGDLKAIQAMELENSDLVKKYSDLALQLEIPPENYFREARTEDASGVARGTGFEREVTEPEKPVGEAELNIVVELKEPPLPAYAILPKFVDKVREFLSQLKYSLEKVADNWPIMARTGKGMPISITSAEPSLYYFFYDSISLVREDNVNETSPVFVEWRNILLKFSNSIDSILTVKPVIHVGKDTFKCGITKEFPDRYKGPREYAPFPPAD